MKKVVTISIMAVLCLITAGTYYALAREMRIEQTGVLYDLDPNTISQIQITNEYGTFLFSQSGEEWLVESQGKYRTNPQKMDLMIAALSNFSISRVLDNEQESYGLEQPAATVAFQAGSTTHSFIIGNETTSRSGVYIRDNGSKRVMITDTASVAQLTGSLAAYRDKEVFTVDKTAIQKLAYYQGGERVVEVENENFQSWHMTYPYDAPARRIELSELVNAMGKWRIAGYPQTLTHAQMGLDSPTQWLEVTDQAGNTQRLEIGSTNGPYTYVRTGGTDEIVSLYTVDLSVSVMDPDALLFVAPLQAAIKDLSAITITAEGKEYHFQLDHNGDNTQITVDNRVLRTEEFSSIFVKYTGLIADGYDSAPQQAGKVMARFQSTYLDGTTVVLELLQRDEDSYYMCIDGVTQYILKAEKLQQLLYRLRDILG